MENCIYWVWLSLAFPYGSQRPRELLNHFETPQQIYALSREDTDLFSERETERMRATSLQEAEKIIALCEKKKISVLTYEDQDYPQRLKNIYAPPMVLYVKGDFSGVDEEVAITIVGTRNASHYGTTITGNLSYQLAKAGVTIISGCAVGIDSYAHLGALKAGGRTIGVLGCGLDVNYPWQNKELKEQILKKGALISEYPPGTEPNGSYFPVRNRILSALSLGVLITEAPVRSGALITAEYALEQGKDLFCVPPHDIYELAYQGVSRYIRDGAIPVMAVEDILFEYLNDFPHKLDADLILRKYLTESTEGEKESLSSRKKSKKRKKNQQSTAIETEQSTEESLVEKESESVVAEVDLDQLEDEPKKLYEVVGETPQTIDEIAGKVDLSLAAVQSGLMELELLGLVHSLPGSRYAR